MPTLTALENVNVAAEVTVWLDAGAYNYTSNKVLGNYTRAAKSFKDRGEFGIYIGNARLIFDIYRPYHGLIGTVREHWDRWRRAGGMPVGVVSGPANAMPREWAYASNMALAYIGAALVIILGQLPQVPAALATIVREAFTGSAAAGSGVGDADDAVPATVDETPSCTKAVAT